MFLPHMLVGRMLICTHKNTLAEFIYQINRIQHTQITSQMYHQERTSSREQVKREEHQPCEIYKTHIIKKIFIFVNQISVHRWWKRGRKSQRF